MQGTLLLRQSTHPLLQLCQTCKSFPPTQLHLLWEQNAAASEKGTPRHRSAHVPGYRGEKMSVCAHLMLQDTCTWLGNGWTSSHTQRSRRSLVSRPGTTEETTHGEQSWRKARAGPCGERLHLSNSCPQKCKHRMLCWGHVQFCLRHFDHCVSSGYPVLFWCSEKSVMPLTESNMANANTRQCLTWITVSKALPNFGSRKVRGWGTVFPLWTMANGAFFKFHIRQPHKCFRSVCPVDHRRLPLSNQQRLSVRNSSLGLGFCTFCLRFKYLLLFLEMRTPQEQH